MDSSETTFSPFMVTEEGLSCGFNETRNLSGLRNASACTDGPGWTYEEYIAFPEYYISLRVYKILVITFFSVGTIGNVLTLAVLSRKTMRSSSSSVYMRALAVSDTIVLWAYFVSLLGNHYYQMIATLWVCRTVYTFQAIGSMYSAWIMISMTLERWIAVTWPFRAGTLCTKKRAVMTVVALAFVVIGLNLHYLWTATSADNVCDMDYGNFKKFHLAWSLFDSCTVIYIPAFAIMILNVMIIVQIRRAQKTQREMTSGEDGPVHSSHLVKGTQQKNNENSGKETRGKVTGRKNKTQKAPQTSSQTRQITTMLLSVSITYWILMFPVAVYYITVDYILEPYTPRRWALIWLLMYLSYGLMLLNHCINFVLYCLTGHKFRKEIRKMFVYEKKAQTSNVSSALHSSATTVSSAPSMAVSTSDVKATTVSPAPSMAVSTSDVKAIT